MRATKLVVVLLVALMAGNLNAQKYSIQKVTSKHLIKPDGQIIIPPTSPVVGGLYGNAYGWLLENPVDGMGVATGVGAQGIDGGDPFSDSTMDGTDEIRGGDFADFIDMTFPQNDILSTEQLESMGTDPGTGRFCLRLTMMWETTASAPQFDTLDMDLFDPLDLDMDGETGAGLDGMFGTADDVVEPDGFFDTGDGILDAPMPLDPPFLVAFAVDNDGDGDPTNDPPSTPASPVYTIGGFFGGTAIAFEPTAGPRTVKQILWIFRDFEGNMIDMNRDGADGLPAFPPEQDADGDGILDSIRTDLIVPPDEDVLGGNGWTGSYGLNFATDASGLTTGELMSGEMQACGYAVDYLSDIENEFGGGGGGDVICGDINMDGEVDLLDVAPFVVLIVDGIFQAEGDINGDGEVDILDVAPFVEKLVGP